jgi:cytochrome c
MIHDTLGCLIAATLLLAGSGRTFAADNSKTGDPAKGEALYARCQGCHSIERNRVGPMHRGLFGRQAGSVDGFNYSAAMKDSGIVWDETTLDTFLSAPRKLVPGTRMTYAGIADAQERADLIAWLKQATR